MDLTTALMAAQAAPDMSSFGRGTAALLGNSDAAYQEGWTAAQKMAKARREAQKHIALNAQAKAFEDQGEPDMANYLLAEVNPKNFTGAALDQQKLGWGNDAMTAATSTGATGAELVNLINMAREGKPSDLTKIDDHTAINPMALPGSQDLDLVTALGEAMVADERASAGKNTAHAGVYDAQAAAGGFNPNTGRRGKVLAPGEGQAKIDWIMAEGTRLAKTRGNDWSEAWVQHELMKAGVNPVVEPRADFSGVTASVDTTAGGDRARPARVAPAAGPSLEAVTYLRQHPELAAAFEAKYGVPAAQYLGQ